VPRVWIVYDGDGPSPEIFGVFDSSTEAYSYADEIARFAPLVPKSQLLPVVVNVPSHRIAPGRIRQLGQAELTVPHSANGERFANLFADTHVRVHLTDDFVTAAWTKLALNAVGAVSAVTLVPRLDPRQPATEALLRQIVEEVMEVGNAEGARIPPDLPDDIVSMLAVSTSTHPNSLHADLLAGRRMEIDARNGAIVRFGAKHAIPTPVNAVLVGLLRTIEVAKPAQRS